MRVRHLVGFVSFVGFVTASIACTTSKSAPPCGAGAGARCAAGQACGSDADCATSSCTSGICTATTLNGQRDGSETDVDCGGLAPACAEGMACKNDGDCSSHNCLSGSCASASAADGKRDGTETDTDCGGTAPPCAVGKKCNVQRDCISNDCDNQTCRVASPTDGRKNGAETDVDCGGVGAPACSPGKGCAAASDCSTAVCDQARCLTATAQDGVQNGSETDVDCGGASGMRCADGNHCLGDSDCGSDVCTIGICQIPTAHDGKKNSDETDIDCGGSSGYRCAPGKACVSGSDCLSDGCRAGVCAIRKSCQQVHGGGTCGKGEFGAIGNAHEDCCISLDVPREDVNGGPYKLDKYLITAGRARVFLESVNYDVRGWIAAHRPAWWKDAWNNSIPVDRGDAMNQLGSGNYPATSWGTNASAGCYAGGGGAATFWESASDQATYSGDVERPYTQNELDEKALNCATEAFFAAFCAWDGGRPMSMREWQYAIRRTLVISNATKPANFFPWNQPGGASAADAIQIWNYANYPTAGTDFAHAGWIGNYEVPTSVVPKGATLRDMAPFVAAPGRFPQGTGQFGHQDLIGVLESAGFDAAGTLGFWFQYSWQERGYTLFAGVDKSRLEAFFPGYSHKHAAIGARCAR